MDEPIKQLVVVAIAVIAGLALIALVKSDGTIMQSISNGITGFINSITSTVSGS